MSGLHVNNELLFQKSAAFVLNHEWKLSFCLAAMLAVVKHVLQK